MSLTTELARSWLQSVAEACEPALSAVLDPGSKTAPDLWAAMRYSVLGGGKRLRPAICLAAALACGAEDAMVRLLPAALSLELIHSYSLIHDDLPAMDDGQMRHGRPTCHRVYGEGMAILAGDALQALAFEVLGRPINGVAPRRQFAALGALATAAGAQGMCGGQALDLASATAQPGSEGLWRLQAAKTGALLVASAVIGGHLASASSRRIAALETYGRELGSAFQITDDILDVVGVAATLGKATGGDSEAGRVTVVSVYGLEAARELARKAATAAADALAGWDDRADRLRALAAFTVLRDR